MSFWPQACLSLPLHDGVGMQGESVGDGDASTFANFGVVVEPSPRSLERDSGGRARYLGARKKLDVNRAAVIAIFTCSLASA